MRRPPDREPARRLKKLQAALGRRRLDAFIVFDRSNAFYLTGFQSSLSFLLVTPREARLLVDGRYVEAARESVRHCEVVWFKKFARSLRDWARSASPRRIGFEGSIPWSRWREFDELLPGTEWVEAGDLILKQRLIKSAAEIGLIAASAKLNDEIYEKALEAARPGATEIDVRNAIRAEADRRGADGEAFDCIVATGVTGSRPHYTPAGRKLARGDLLLIDMGMKAAGYCSDMTRCVALGRKPKARMMRVFEAVLEAEEAALAEIGPGVRCADLHRIALERLKRRRLARYFTHGLGHGVGLEVHEAPRLALSSVDTLRAGMVVTVEPGAYLPGVGGARVEDLVAVTRNGHRVLSRAEKSFRVIPFD